jgi:hypothetical protein
MTSIEIHAGSYHADVLLDALPDLPINNIRKLFRIIFKAAGENPILSISDWLKSAIPEAESEWHAESVKLQNTYYATKAKVRYERLMKIQSIFNETKEKYYA